MFVIDAPAAPRVVRSASDLKAAVECEWGLMRRLDAKLGRVQAVPEPEDALNRRAARLGDEHELRELQRLVASHGDHVPGSPGGVAQIARPADSTDPAPLAAAQRQTLDAIRDGADVVFQGTFFDGAFLGFADFLMRDGPLHDGDGDRWRVVDTKLARRARVTALLQIAAYAQQLRRLGVPVAPQADLMLGDGTVSTHRLTDIVPVHALRQQRLDDLIAQRLAATGPIAWGDASARACSRCAECAAQIEATRDVLLVGRLTVHQRDRLLAAGITTIDRLAVAAGPVEGMPQATLRSLQGQARMQLAAPPEVPGAPHRVLAELRDPSGLAALPEPDAGDIFFDFEGDPLWTDDDTTWGLEYLFGVVDHDVANQGVSDRDVSDRDVSGRSVSNRGVREHYRPFWAHDRAGERRALLDFLHFVADRRRRHPGLHVYHYADYERSHLQQLCARHGVGEAILDELLSEHVLVDLYPIVTRSIRISDRSYSLKKLEPLYMGGELRQSEVTTGAGSVDAYVSVIGSRAAGRTAEADALLVEIADYNRYDCVSTLRLRDWLLARADEHGVPRRIAPPARDAAEQTIARREDAARDALLAAIEGVDAADRTADQTAIALAAAAIEYHRREDKAFWWEHFNRQVSPPDEWADQRDVLIVEHAALRSDWQRHPGDRLDSRLVVLVGRIAPGSTLKAGDSRSVMYDEPVPAGCDPVPSGQRGEHVRGAVRDVELLADGRLQVLLKESAASAAEHWPQLPMALTPGPPFRTAAQRQAILEWGERLAGDAPSIAGGAFVGRPDAALDLVRRSPPRLHADAALHPSASSSASSSPATVITAAVLALNDSYVAVQGPPGSGKTTVGAQVIAELVQRYHWRVGVVAQSHPVVENLLHRLLDGGLDPALVAKKPQTVDPTVPPWTVLADTPDFGRFLAQHADTGCVLGGTAWDFANANKVPRGALDLLVVDEAGQYSLANTVAVAVAARSLLLLGDPQQLPQVSQGRHPEPVDASALGWLSAGHDVLPQRFGVFLAESWRMHPALCAAVSDLSYEGRLRSKLPQATDRDLPGIAPGVHPVPVVHAGDASESPAESAEVVRLVTAHLGLPWSDGSRSRDPLTQADVIVVAPYNAQVALIRTDLAAAGHPDVEVGTVDRFQGREAVIAIVSLTASSAAEVPRGIGFVLLRNRLNVAISRAKWAAYLVHSPALADTLPVTAPALADLSAFLRLVGRTGQAVP